MSEDVRMEIIERQFNQLAVELDRHGEVRGWKKKMEIPSDFYKLLVVIDGENKDIGFSEEDLEDLYCPGVQDEIKARLRRLFERDRRIGF